MTSALGYAVVTPARDEADGLVRVAECLAAQTEPPIHWVIVDNGSTDRTREVATQLAERHSWILVRDLPGERGQTRGGPVVRAFHAGLEEVDAGVAFVAKLDADVTFDPDYFERLLAEFAADASLGIASGACYEDSRGRWRARHTTQPNVWGAARVYRRECLASLLPLDDRMGWDAIDVLRANVLGWTTRTCGGIPFRHHRVEAVRDGARHRRWLRQGEIAHYLRYRPSYLLLRALHHARSDAAAFAMLLGYARAAATRQPRCGDDAVVAHVRNGQRLRHLRRRAVEATGGAASQAA